MNHYKGFLIAILCVIALFMFRAWSTEADTSKLAHPIELTHTVEPAQVATPVVADSLAIPPEEDAVVNKAHADLALLAAKSPKAGSLLEFWDTNAGRARLYDAVGTIQLARLPTQKTDHVFFVAGDPKIPALPVGQMVSIAVFQCGNRVLLFRNNQLTAVSNGLVSAHELQHAVECTVNHEPLSSSRNDPNWLLGEERAYGATRQILNEYTDGQWGRLVETSRKKRETLMLAALGHTNAVSFGVAEEERGEIERLLGGSDVPSLSLLVQQLEVDMGMENVMLKASAAKLDSRALTMRRIEFMAKFYKHQNFLQ